MSTGLTTTKRVENSTIPRALRGASWRSTITALSGSRGSTSMYAVPISFSYAPTVPQAMPPRNGWVDSTTNAVTRAWPGTAAANRNAAAQSAARCFDGRRMVSLPEVDGRYPVVTPRDKPRRVSSGRLSPSREEGVDSAPDPGRRHHRAELHGFDGETLVDGDVDAARDAAEARGDRFGRMARDLLRQRPCVSRQRRMFDDPVDEPEPRRLVRVDRLGAEDHLQRALSADQPGQALRAAERRREAEADLRLREACPVAGQRERRRFGDLASGAERDPVHGDDQRLRVALDLRGQPLAATDEVAQRPLHPRLDAPGEFSDVRAGAEGALSRACEDHGANAGVRLDLVERLGEAIDQRVIERIQLLGPVQRQESDAVVDVPEEGRHAPFNARGGWNPPPPRARRGMACMQGAGWGKRRPCPSGAGFGSSPRWRARGRWPPRRASSASTRPRSRGGWRG